MNICGFSPIPILITFLCCGILFVYFNLRMSEIRQAVEKQNKVLTAFITNIQQDIRGGGVGSGVMGNSSNIPLSDSMASPIALHTAQKIEVSDDDDSEGEDTDSDTESDDECSDEEHDNINEQTIKPIILNEMSLNEMSLNEMSLNEMSLNEMRLEGVSVLAFEVVDTGNISQDNSNSSITEITDDIVDLGEKSGSAPHYETMKVDDLRVAVVNKNLCSKDDAKKLKKPELLALLKN
jgi:hypothetical protein